MESGIEFQEGEDGDAAMNGSAVELRVVYITPSKADVLRALPAMVGGAFFASFCASCNFCD
jgi:hypothetical protein